MNTVGNSLHFLCNIPPAKGNAMTHQLKVLGVALGAVFAMGAVAAPMASATTVDIGTHPNLFTASVGATEVAKIDSEQTAAGKDTFTIHGLVVTCNVVNFKGTAVETTVEGKTVDKKGPSSTDITFGELTYEGCHVVVAGITKAVTFTTNGCGYIYHAQTTTTEDNVTHVKTFDNIATTTIECPAGKQIEIHIYNTNKSPHEPLLCTYDIKPQGPLVMIGLSNKVNTPTSVNDVIATPNLTFPVINTKLSLLCGETENTTATYKGEDTLRATNEAGAFVDMSISD